MIFKKNKKGVIFTILAILLSAMFFLILSPLSTNQIDAKIELDKNRATAFSSYYDSLVAYSEFAFEIPIKECGLELSKYSINTKYFFEDNSSFLMNMSTCIFNGTINGNPLIRIENRTTDKLIDLFAELAEKDYGIKTNYSIKSYNYEIRLPQTFRMNSMIKYVINNADSELSPKLNKITIDVLIKDVYDPYYSLNINETKKIDHITLLDDEDLRGITFEDFLNNISYIYYKNGVSFLDRMVNNTIYSQNQGIISFVNTSNPLNRINNSFVDVYYIQNLTFGCSQLWCHPPNCTDSDFAIDSETFLTLKTIYDLDISDWETKC